jgi:hypothetical protein
MTILRQTLRTQCWKALLAGVALSALLSASAPAAEREGSVFFFSMEDLQEVLSHPTLFSLPALWQSWSSFAWQEQDAAEHQDGPLERNARWGNGLGIDGYTRPGTRPLWGY